MFWENSDDGTMRTLTTRGWPHAVFFFYIAFHAYLRDRIEYLRGRATCMLKTSTKIHPDRLRSAISKSSYVTSFDFNFRVTQVWLRSSWIKRRVIQYVLPDVSRGNLLVSSSRVEKSKKNDF